MTRFWDPGSFETWEGGQSRVVVHEHGFEVAELGVIRRLRELEHEVTGVKLLPLLQLRNESQQVVQIIGGHNAPGKGRCETKNQNGN